MPKFERRTLSESRALFAAATARLLRRQAGPWTNRDAALHAEVRAMLLGLAVPRDTDSIPAGGLVRLSDATYRDRRAGDDGVARAAASALLKVAEHVGPDGMIRIFPKLAAATAAVGRLRDGELPQGFADFDRVVVDEVQDLTLLETAVVVEMCLAIARRRGHAPWLLAAGDDGQTVRPSGFDWGGLNDVLAARLDAPRQFHLEDNLRCPSRISAVIERASQWVRAPRQVAAPDQATSPADHRAPRPQTGRCRPQALLGSQAITERDDLCIHSQRRHNGFDCTADDLFRVARSHIHLDGRESDPRVVRRSRPDPLAIRMDRHVPRRPEPHRFSS